jgi:ubiquinone/menaquinone biosynthesis C-methylase UbiE
MRDTAPRVAVVRDALSRGLAPEEPRRGVAVEVGSGTGTYSPLLAERFATVVAVDLSREMLTRAPPGPAFRVQGDGSQLPLRDGSAACVALINAFLFPSEVVRALEPRGALVWVNTSGEQTPIYLSAEELLSRLAGEWTGVASRAGAGHWCVLRRS